MSHTINIHVLAGRNPCINMGDCDVWQAMSTGGR